MSADEETIGPFYNVPTEILLQIFNYLPGKDLVRCRRICLRWKSIINEMIASEVFWNIKCQREFNSCYFSARAKADISLGWFDLYKSLHLWPSLNDAVEDVDEFASAHTYHEEVQSLEILGTGLIAVHKKNVIQYYDLNTLKLTTRTPITGNYALYRENDSLIVIQSYQLHLYVIRKYTQSPSEEKMKTFHHVKMCLLTDYELYFVYLTNEVHYCDTNNNDAITSKSVFAAQDEDYVISLGFKDDCLNILTGERKIYTVVDNKEAKYVKSLSNHCNILSTLHEFNFLGLLDWRVYFQWMFVLNHTVPDGPMRDLIIIRPYGDVFFVGTNSGVFSIFYRPYIDGEIDLFHSEPLHRINFMERADIPILSTCPIIQIDVLEVELGHIVFVAMPKKIAVLKYKHDLERTPSWILNPYEMNYIF